MTNEEIGLTPPTESAENYNAGSGGAVARGASCYRGLRVNCI